MSSYSDLRDALCGGLSVSRLRYGAARAEKIKLADFYRRYDEGTDPMQTNLLTINVIVTEIENGFLVKIGGHYTDSDMIGQHYHPTLEDVYEKLPGYIEKGRAEIITRRERVDKLCAQHNPELEPDRLPEERAAMGTVESVPTVFDED